MEAKAKKVYFPNLNGLRAIGAFIVLIGHIEFIKQFWKLPAYPWFPIPGKIGVALFFALSGFLITSLLLEEQKTFKTIKLKHFYIRRILRIWPLYYLVVAMSIFLFNSIDFLKIPNYSDNVLQNLNLTNILILILLLPNFTHYYIPYADQRWSIIVEEQFYLFQPLLIRVLKKRALLSIAFTSVLFSPEIFSLLYRSFHLESFISPNFLVALTTQFKYLACIAIGCLFSLIFFKRDTYLKRKLFSPFVQYGVVLIIVVTVSLGHFVYATEELLDYRVYTLLFAIIVLNASQNKKTIFRFEGKAFNFTGSISYGIYMYHPVCIGIAIAIGTRISDNLVLQNVIIYLVSIVLTILVSWASFRYFEAFFLRLKSRVQPNKESTKAESLQLLYTKPND